MSKVRNMTIEQLVPDADMRRRLYQVCKNELSNPSGQGQHARVHQNLLDILNEDRERLLQMEVLPEYLAYAYENAFLNAWEHELGIRRES